MSAFLFQICDIKKVTDEDLMYHKIKDLLSSSVKDLSRASRGNKSPNDSLKNFENPHFFRCKSLCEMDAVSNMENIFPLESKYSEWLPAPSNKGSLQLNRERFAKNQHYPLTEAHDFSNESFHEPCSSCGNVNPSSFPSSYNAAYITNLMEVNCTDSNDKIKDNEFNVKKPISLVFPQIIQDEKTVSNPQILHNHREPDVDFDSSDIDNDVETSFSEEKEDENDDIKADILQILEGESKSDSNHSGAFFNGGDDTGEISTKAIPPVKEKRRNCLKFRNKALFLNNVNRKDTTKNFKTDCPKNKIKTVDWRLEKNIQVYNLYLRYSQLSEENRIKNEIIFVDLFGENSEDEEDSDYCSYSLYYTSCIERISPWVVKYLMPYYRQHRIIGRDVFKKLGLHVSKLIIEKVEYPDEGLVQFLVSKFFSNSMIYTCESDIVEITVNL